MNFKPISTENDYDNALERIFELLQTNPFLNSPESKELDFLTTLVEDFEAIHYNFPPKTNI
jgi:HTH-type transcriptional regulator / antitoxin HigA